MIKFYVPDGHLESKTNELFSRAGFGVRASERSYRPSIDDDEIKLKKLRPQDFPFAISLNKGDIGICGSDILKEFGLTYPDLSRNVVEVLDLKFGKTRLVMSISEDALPGIKSTADFAKYAKNSKDPVVVASEYPAIAKDYLNGSGIKNIIIRKPAGKTEAWAIPPIPEADAIIDTTETGTTLRENRCRILGEVMESTARLIVNRKSLNDKTKKAKIEEIIQLFRGALEAKGRVNVYMNVLESDNLDGVLNVLKGYVEKPTISNLKGGGYDIFMVIGENNLKYLMPKLIKKGATSIVISDTRMILR